MLPNRAKSFYTVSLPYAAHDVTSRDRLDAIFLPFARYHTSWLLFAFAARNFSLSSFSWPIQEYPYPLFKDFTLLLRFECILYRSLLLGKEIFAFSFRYFSYNFSEIPVRETAHAPTLSSPSPVPWGKFGSSLR